MPHVPLKNKKYYTVSCHISICAHSVCDRVYHVSKYAQSYEGGGFSEK